MFWDTLRLLSLEGLTTPGLFRQQSAGRSPSSGSLSRGSSSASIASSASGGSAKSDGSGSSGGHTAAAEQSGGGDEAVGANSGRKVLLCKRLYDSGQDALKVLPSTTKDLHAVSLALLAQFSGLFVILQTGRRASETACMPTTENVVIQHQQ